VVSDDLLDRLVCHHRLELQNIGEALSQREFWSLEAECVVIDAREIPSRLHRTTVRGITGIITTSNVVSRELMQRFLRRYREVGTEEALNEFMNGADAEEFAELWDSYTEERKEQGMSRWSYDDAAAFAQKSKSAFQDGELALVALCGESTLLTFTVKTKDL